MNKRCILKVIDKSNKTKNSLAIKAMKKENKDRLLTKKEAEKLTVYIDKYMKLAANNDEVAEKVLDETVRYYKKHKALVGKELKASQVNFWIQLAVFMLITIHFIAHIVELF